MSINRAATLAVIRPYRGIGFAVYIHMVMLLQNEKQLYYGVICENSPSPQQIILSIAAYKRIGKLWKDSQQTENRDY